ncbi:DUF1778 domain-containing protein [Aquibium sp. ELW1220]|uniref:type II toxin-antitoxin system TacA family antitoxin n=1 Tax=Aquibium sp. ELW1220 TaxID=2976766 RepID=UPI0025AFAD49|nr:DUF1778 domain-containing protein [Aquibium sp. ELW1220]MDN2583956.1 DUF1778 domain-containing protein [Aquibium sp. ELW1220]
MPARPTRTEKLDLRLTPDAKRTLAAAERRSISDFVLDSALGRAADTLADRRSFHLDEERWRAFADALDEPARDLPRLRKLLVEPGIFSGREPA